MSVNNEEKTFKGSYAVIFSSTLSDGSEEDIVEYQKMADLMVELAAKQPGFIGIESTRGADGLGISVSYWQDLKSIEAWKNNDLHQLARKKGKEHWYQSFSLKVAKIERAYSLDC